MQEKENTASSSLVSPMSKYGFAPTMQNEGGRKIILMDQMNHMRRVNNARSVVDTRPPHSIKSRRAKVRNPDPSPWIRDASRPHSRGSRYMSNDGLPRVSHDGQLLDDRGLLERAYTAHSRRAGSNFNLHTRGSLWDASFQDGEQSAENINRSVGRRSLQSSTSPFEQRPYPYTRPVSTTPYTSNTRMAKSKLNESSEEEHHRRMNTKSALGYIEGSGEQSLSHLPVSSKNYEQRVYITRQTYIDANKSITQQQQQRARRHTRKSVARNASASLEQDKLHESSNHKNDPILERPKRNTPSAKRIGERWVRDGLSDPVDKILDNKFTPSRVPMLSDDVKPSNSEIYQDDALDTSRSFDSTTTIDSEVERLLMEGDIKLTAHSKHMHLIDIRIYDAFVDMLSKSDQLSDPTCLKEILDSVEQAVTERRLLKNYTTLDVSESQMNSTRSTELKQAKEMETKEIPEKGTEESTVRGENEIGESVNSLDQNIVTHSEAIDREVEDVDDTNDAREIESSNREDSPSKEAVESWDEQKDGTSDFDDEEFEEEIDVNLISENDIDDI